MVQTSTSPGGCDVNILLAGQTGVGRSTLINMIIGAVDGSTPPAKVSNDARPCPIETTEYAAPLGLEGTNVQCRLWDTRGLDEAVDHPNLMAMAANWLRQQGFGRSPKPDRDLRNACRERISDVNDGGNSASVVIVIWCIHASKIDVPIHWQHFRKVYVEYCHRKVKPVVVITQMTPGFAKDWEKRCKEQLSKLDDTGLGCGDTSDLLISVRRFRDMSSPEYAQDSKALKELISRLSGASS